MMGDIYKSCCEVVAYLGNAYLGDDFYLWRLKPWVGAPPVERFLGTDADIPRTLEIIKEAFTVPKEGVPFEPLHIFAAAKMLTMLGSGGVHLGDIPLFWATMLQDPWKQAFTNFMHSCRWWERIWVLQEVTLAPAVTVMCGSVTAPWSIFATAAKGYRHHAETCCAGWAQQYLGQSWGSWSRALNDFTQPISDIEELRRVYRHDPADGPIAKWSLLRLLRTFRERCATDARDIVYALLGLADPEGVVPTVDYSMSVVDIHRKTTLDIIHSMGSLDLFSTEFGFGNTEDNYPRWVPGWRLHGLWQQESRADIIGLYNACPGFSASPDNIRQVVSGRSWSESEELREHDDAEALSSPSNKLLVRGIAFDKVVGIGGYAPTEGPGPDWTRISHWVNYLAHQGILERGGNSLWKLLCAETISSGPGQTRRVLPEDEVLYSLCYKVILRSQTLSVRGAERRDGGSSQQDYVSSWSRLFFGEEELTIQEVLHSFHPPAVVEGATDWDWYEWVRQRPEWFEITSGPYAHLFSERANYTEELWAQFLGYKVSRHTVGFHAAAVMSRSISKATSHRRLFWTERGRIGLGPWDMKPGDDLYLLQGGKAPFILWPGIPCSVEVMERDGVEDTPERVGTVASPLRMYAFLGDCYCQGVMDGEVLQESSDSSAGSWRDIVLQ